MANRRSKKKRAREIIVESDFLFGLQKSDSRHSKIIRALNLHKNGTWHIKILSSAVIEISNVLYSRGFTSKTVEEAVSLMDEILKDCGVEDFIALELSDLIVAEKL